MGEANLVLGYADRFLVRKLPLLLVCLSAKGNQAGSRTRTGKRTSAEEGWRIREGFAICVAMFVSVCRPHLRFPETSRTFNSRRTHHLDHTSPYILRVRDLLAF